jgi:hypothetical protein
VIHEGASERDYALLRAWILGLWSFEVLRTPLTHLDRLPSAAFAPPELFQRIIPGRGTWLMQAGVPDAVQWAAVCFLIGALVLRRSAWLAVAAGALVTVHQGLIRSFTYVFHAELALLYALYVIVLFEVVRVALPPGATPASNTPTSAAESRGATAGSANVWGVPFLGVLGALCLTYSLTGVHRIVSGGPSLFLSDTLERWLVDRPLVFGRGNGEVLVGLPAAPVWLNVGFAMVTLFEALALFALVSRRFRLPFVAVMAGFHVSTYVFMGIAFWQNLLLLPLFLFERKGGAAPPPRRSLAAAERGLHGG